MSALRDWHKERLAEIQSCENVVRQHIDAIRLRAEHYPEPWRTEFKSQAIVLRNLYDWIQKVKIYPEN